MIEIVTDSSAHLPPEQRQQYHIHVVPLKAIFGMTEYRDEIDLTNAQFYQMLPNAKEHPTTSQPSAGDFIEVYKPLLDAGQGNRFTASAEQVERHVRVGVRRENRAGASVQASVAPFDCGHALAFDGAGFAVHRGGASRASRQIAR